MKRWSEPLRAADVSPPFLRRPYRQIRFFQKNRQKSKTFPNLKPINRIGVFLVPPLRYSPAAMNDSNPLPNHTTLAVEDGFLFNDWELPEKNPTEETPQFDGKIIARMPDLGADSFTQNVIKSKVPSYWERIGGSIATMIQGNASPSARSPHNTRRHFFLRFTTFGCVILLCGLGILFIENENQSDATDTHIADNGREISEPSATNVQAVVIKEDPFVSSRQQESNDFILGNGSTPLNQFPSVTSFDSAVAVPPPPIDHLPGQAENVWNRPAANEYSPWTVASRQPESPSTGVAVPPSPVPTNPTAAVAMSPMINMSMPVSPYEQQLLAQANSAPIRPPVDPFVQPNNYVVPGMIAMHDRQENSQGVAARYPQNVRQPVSTPVQTQYLPPSAVQGVHAPYNNQYNPNAVPPNMPIPSGVSTLPQQGQGGYYQPHGPAAAAVPYSHGDFYSAPPSTYRKVY